ncbi:MAG: hypothetical protein ABIR32_00735 [Ilumatobacteraceae bacterium]
MLASTYVSALDEEQIVNKRLDTYLDAPLAATEGQSDSVQLHGRSSHMWPNSDDVTSREHRGCGGITEAAA